MKVFYDPKHILYITRSLRESCEILTKGFNNEFPPECLIEHPIHYLVHFCDLLLNGTETVRNTHRHVYCNYNSKQLLSGLTVYLYIINVEVMFRYICVFKVLRH